MSPESAAQKALICGAICAMKDRLRLAQSLSRQPFEQIGFFGQFSRLLEGNFRHCKKRDSETRSGSCKTWILRAGNGGSGFLVTWSGHWLGATSPACKREGERTGWV